MKKSILILIISALLFTVSCSVHVNKKDTPDAVESPTTLETIIPSEDDDIAETSTPTSLNNKADSGLTLAGLKEAAQIAGYQVDTVDEYQMPEDPKAVDGFTVIYSDEYSSAYIPVFEFVNADDAMAYSAQVNESGYNLCIVNGKFMTMTSAMYGVPLNDNEKNLLETLLESKVMTYPEPSPVLIKPAKDFSEAFLQIDAITNALDRLVNKSVLLHDKAVVPDERIAAAFITFSMISSSDLAFLSVLSEDQAQLDAIVQLWEMFGCTEVEIQHDVAHDYVMTGKRAGLDTSFTIHCSFDPCTGSLRLTDIDGEEPVELFEYVPLGGDKYAFQTMYERAIVEYKNGEVASFVYSLKTRSNDTAYTEADSIYISSTGVSEEWVSASGEDSYEQYITYEGTTIKIAADSFMGDRLKTEIEAQH